MKSYRFLQEKIVTEIFLANPKVFQQKKKHFGVLPYYFRDVEFGCLVVLCLLVLLQLSCHVAGYGTRFPESPLPESLLPAHAGAAASQSEHELYGSLPRQGDDVCADAVLRRGGPGLLDSVCKVLGASTDP